MAAGTPTVEQLRRNAYRAKRRLFNVPQRFRVMRAEKAALRSGIYGSATNSPPWDAAIFYAGKPDLDYQVRQWLTPFADLAPEVTTGVIAADAMTALRLAELGTLPVLWCPDGVAINEVIDGSPLKVLFYVNNMMANWEPLARLDLAHVALGHGESDKGASTSGNFKSYDYLFATGEAALRRFAAGVAGIDWRRQVIVAGRPQIDFAPTPPPLVRDDRIKVLYAPTWEGDKPSGAYSSLASHGVAIARAITSNDSMRLVFRPHPLAGSKDPQVHEARQTIERVIREANAVDPMAHHVHDTSPTFGWHMKCLDVCIGDISSVVYDWAASRKPLIITRPTAAEVVIPEDGFAAALPLLPPGEIGQLATQIHDYRTNGMPAIYDELVTYYLGATEPGESRNRFGEAVSRVLTSASELTRQEKAAAAAAATTGTRTSANPRKRRQSQRGPRLSHSLRTRAAALAEEAVRPGSLDAIVYVGKSPDEWDAVEQARAVLEGLAGIGRVGIVCRLASTVVQGENRAPAATYLAQTIGDLEVCIAGSDARYAFYLNDSTWNMHGLASQSVAHVLLMDVPRQSLPITHNLVAYDAIVVGSEERKRDVLNALPALPVERVIVAELNRSDRGAIHESLQSILTAIDQLVNANGQRLDNIKSRVASLPLGSSLADVPS